MTLFYNGELEEILLFVQNFQMTLEGSEERAAGTNIQYYCTLLHGEALHQLDTLSVEVGSTTSENLKIIVLVLGTYSFLVNALSKKSDAPWNEESA